MPCIASYFLQFILDNPDYNIRPLHQFNFGCPVLHSSLIIRIIGPLFRLYFGCPTLHQISIISSLIIPMCDFRIAPLNIGCPAFRQMSINSSSIIQIYNIGPLHHLYFGCRALYQISFNSSLIIQKCNT